MKSLATLCLLALMALSYAKPQTTHSRGCIYIMGQCVEECPVGTHEYDSFCGPLTPEATCDEPHPVTEQDDTCDYSDCYCDPPTVRDTVSKKCVTLEQCPKKPKKDKPLKLTEKSKE